MRPRIRRCFTARQPIAAAGWTDAQRQEEARLEKARQQANEAVMAAGRATSTAWAAIAAGRADAKAVGDAIASEVFAMHRLRKGQGRGEKHRLDWSHR